MESRPPQPNSGNSMFNDRRRSCERRRQNLAIPVERDRRRNDRRSGRQFQNKPWWLSTNYAAELQAVRETIVLESVADSEPPDQQQR